MQYWYSGQERLSGWHLDPNEWAFLLGLAALLVTVRCIQIARRPRWGLVVVSLLALMICGAGIMRTYSRGGMVGFACGLAVVLFVARPRMVIVFAVLAAVTIPAAFTPEIGHRLSEIVPREQDLSVQNRLFLWREGLNMMQNNPAGVGLSAIGSEFAKWYQPPTRRESYRTMVSLPLTLGVAWGFVGCGLYAACLSFIALLAWRGWQLRPDAWALWFCGASACFAGSVLFSTLTLEVFFFTVLAVAQVVMLIRPGGRGRLLVRAFVQSGAAGCLFALTAWQGLGQVSPVDRRIERVDITTQTNASARIVERTDRADTAGFAVYNPDEAQITKRELWEKVYPLVDRGYTVLVLEDEIRSQAVLDEIRRVIFQRAGNAHVLWYGRPLPWWLVGAQPGRHTQVALNCYGLG